MKDKFAERVKVHDEFESKIMDKMRPFTTRKHLPDRFVSFPNKLYAWDAKTNIFVEKNSHDEYFRVQEENNIPVFIVYQDKGIIMAGWITEINWEGPFPPSPNSTSGDPYYRISGGRTLDEFLEGARQKEYGNE